MADRKLISIIYVYDNGHVVEWKNYTNELWSLKLPHHQVFLRISTSLYFVELNDPAQPLKAFFT